MNEGTDTQTILCEWISEQQHIDLAKVQQSVDAPIRNMIDSISMIDMLLYIEETFGLELDDEEITPENFATISMIAEFVMAKRVLAASA